LNFIKVINELRGLFFIAQKERNMYELEECLNNFSSLVQVVDIPSKIRNEIGIQIRLFQRRHLVDQFNGVISETKELFEKRRFEKYINRIVIKNVL
jgi:hypothetical protein